jgi:polyvinyl alcohol dehydrogenase (cytochrome)
MLRNMMIAGGFALAAVTTGCATTPAAPAAPAAATTPAAPAAPAAPSAAAMAAGEATFMGRCNGCHGSGRNGAPAVDVLAAKAPGDIVTALTTGKMAAMGAALTAEDKANVAMFLTKKPV